MADFMLPPTTSASQLVSYAMCPRKYCCGYVLDREPEFLSISLVLGSAVHSAIGWFFEERLQGHDPTLSAALATFSADIQAGTAHAPIRWKESSPEALEAQGHELLRMYLTDRGTLPVAAVEQPFELDVQDPDTGECLPRPLRGYLDLVLEDHTIVELKTSAKAWNPNDLARHLQIGAYVAAANAMHGGPSKVAVHVLVKTKKPRLEEHVIERGEPGNRWWFEAAFAIERAIAAGHFPPSPGPLCHECEYQKTCLAGVGHAASDAPPLRIRPSTPEPLVALCL